MSATALTPTTVVSPHGPGPGPGVAEASADTGNGNSFVNDGRTGLIARNSDASDHTVTVQGKAFTVPAEKTICIGPFPVFQAYGPTVTATGSDTKVKLVAYSVPHGASAKR
jgi:hypothetical protein